MDVKPDEKAFRRLIENIVNSDTSEKRPKVQMQIDADLFENPSRFFDKYWEMRSEDGEAKRRELLGNEVHIIQEFVQGGGVIRVVKEVLQQDAVKRTGSELPSSAVDALADRFTTENFRLEGVRTKQPLKCATWEVKGWQGTDDTLLARQEYNKDTLMTERRWKLGRQSVIDQLANSQYASNTLERGAAEVADAVAATRQLETVGFTARGPSENCLGGTPAR